MNTSSILQIVGNVCLILAMLVLFFALPRVLAKYAELGVQDDRWEAPAIAVLAPLWLLLTGALLCMTAAGGFAWLRPGGPVLYALTVAAGIALAAVTFVFMGLYIRPGFTPRGLYSPLIYSVPLVTSMLVLAALNPKIATALPTQWMRMPWAILTGISIVISFGYFGYYLATDGVSSAGRRVAELVSPHFDEPGELASIATLDPQTDHDFDKLLSLAGKYHGPKTRAAATARLRELPDLNTRLINLLKSTRSNTIALEYIEAATLTPEEQKLFVGPTRTALLGFIGDIPLPHFTTRERQKQLLRWGRKAIPTIIAKFAATDVDFSGIMPAFEEALRPNS